MAPKPICYLDLGGVVFYDCIPSPGKDCKGYREIRPNTIRLLKTIHDYGYELRFLTGDPYMGKALNGLLDGAFLDEFPEWGPAHINIPSCVGNEDYEQPGAVGHGKHRFVDPTREFIWIEDEPVTEDVTWLHKNGWRGRFCKVNAFNHDVFTNNVIPWIKAHESSKKAD